MHATHLKRTHSLIIRIRATLLINYQALRTGPSITNPGQYIISTTGNSPVNYIPKLTMHHGRPGLDEGRNTEIGVGTLRGLTFSPNEFD